MVVHASSGSDSDCIWHIQGASKPQGIEGVEGNDTSDDGVCVDVVCE